MGMIYHKKRLWSKLKEEREKNSSSTENNSQTSEQPEENSSDSYTKTDINRMSTAELQELAENEGIEGAHEKSGGELKKMLIEHFSL